MGNDPIINEVGAGEEAARQLLKKLIPEDEYLSYINGFKSYITVDGARFNRPNREVKYAADEMTNGIEGYYSIGEVRIPLASIGELTQSYCIRVKAIPEPLPITDYLIHNILLWRRGVGYLRMAANDVMM